MSPKLKEYFKKQEEKIANFKTKYPNLIRDIKYFSVDKGWYPLLHSLCLNIESHIESLPLEIQGGIYVVQVKEKFGGLRFHMNESVPYIDGAIALAESMSYSICEQCGQPGITRSGGWIKVRCNRHEAAYQKQKAKENERCRKEQVSRAQAKAAAESLSKQGEISKGKLKSPTRPPPQK